MAQIGENPLDPITSDLLTDAYGSGELCRSAGHAYIDHNPICWLILLWNGAGFRLCVVIFFPSTHFEDGLSLCPMGNFLASCWRRYPHLQKQAGDVFRMRVAP